MSEIVASTAGQVFEGIASSTGQGAGQTVEQWLAEENFKRVVDGSASASNSPVYRWNYSAQDAFDKVVDESNAQQAYENWLNSGGNQSSTGSASQPQVKAGNPQTAIKKAGAGSATAGGLLSMSLPTWVAAAAPLLGVGVGVALYESNPELWTKISKTLLPFCYEESQAMPVVTDEDGNTYIDKEAVEALKRLLEDEGIGDETYKSSYVSGNYTRRSSTIGTAIPITYFSTRIIGCNSDGCTLVAVESGNATIIYGVNSESSGVVHTVTATSDRQSSSSPYEIIYGTGSNYNVGRNSYTLDGRTVYYTLPIQISNSTYQGEPIVIAPAGDAIADGDTIEKILWTVIYGQAQGDGYQTGTSKWGSGAVDIGSLPRTQVYTDPEDATKTRDYIPVALPTEPGQSLEQETNPDPTQNQDPEAQVSPYIMPTIPNDQYPEGSESEGEEDQELDKNAPIPVPVPNPDNQTDPQENPTEEPEQPPQKLVDLIPPIDSGNIPKPNMPGIGDPLNVDGGVGGLVSVYNPTYAELQAFAQWLWVTYADATIDKIWNNPFDGVISLHELYATPNKGARKNIKSGFLVSPVSSITIPNRYSEINCGTAIFPEYWGNYLDYSPYSKALCYLPFIGIVELNVDDIVGHAVNITYRVDSYSGAVIALLTCAKTGSNAVLYQFSGNCSVQMPIAGGTQAAIKAAQISAGAYQNAYHTAGLAGLLGGMLGGLGSLLTGNVGGAISQAIGGAGSYATNQAFGQANYTSQTVGAKSSVQHSGQFGESFGAMGAKRPYMIIKRPVQVVVQNYQDEYGYQAHKYVTIGECEGYLRCRGVHVQSARATDSEKHAIEQMLMEGVYVT